MIPLRSAIPLVAIMAVAACSDAPTGPTRDIDSFAAATVMPSVMDARVRVTPGIENAAIRTRVAHDLQQLEFALTGLDGQKARFHLRVIASVLADYRKQMGSTTHDGADVTAIALALNQVSSVVNAGYDINA